MEDDLILDYIEEAQDILSRLTSLLDEMNPSAVQSEEIEELFRGIHTIKGGAGMFDWDNTKDVAHELESFLGECRKNPAIFDYKRVRREVDKIETLIENNDCVGKGEESSEFDGNNVDLVQNASLNSKYFEKFCFDFDEFLASQMANGNHYYEVLIPSLVKDRFKKLIEGHKFELICEEQLGDNLALLISCTEENRKVNYDFLAKLYEFDTFHQITLIENQNVSNNEPSLLEEVVKEKNQAVSSTKKVDVLRVPIDKINDALNSIWEIFLLRNQIAYLFEKNKRYLQGKSDIIQEWEILDNALKRNIDELESTTMSMRMNDMTALFSRMKKVVRSYQSNTNKEIDFVVEGEEIELDKKVLDMLGEPLIHLVRNAMDHGVESPSDREKSNKSRVGVILLKAESMSDKVVISLKDDGKGINPDKILEKAKEKNIPVDHLKTPAEIINLIFAPGFSTAEQVTDVSGRGVGMDAVRRSIQKLGGEIFIDSVVGEGSTFKIELPLSMSVISSILFDVNGKTYGSSINNLVEVCREPEDILQTNNETVLFPYRGDFLECYDLRKHFTRDDGVETQSDSIATFCVMEVNGRKAAIRVNKVTKHTDIVVKEMRGAFPSVDCLNGVSILATGEPIFVVSLTKVVRTLWEGDSHAA